MSDLIGQKINQYRILEKSGGGGMGVVYKAKDEKLDRIVALKFLPPHLLADEEAEERFMTEAKSASSLDHPNICTIYDINKTEDGRLFIVMAFYEGETLKKKISRGSLDVDEAVNIALQIASGLERAHKGGIVHRDVKPANVMITKYGEVKIVDFGLAKSKASAGVTKFGSTVGTAAYMSPEQTRGETIDQRTDIWALGIILYEMLTGAGPFKGEYEQAIIYSILNDELPEINEIPEELNSIIKKSTAKDASSRYSTISEMHSDLMLLKGDSGSRVSASRISGTGFSGQSISGTPVPGSEGPPNRRGMNIGMKWILTAAAAVIILVIAGWFYFSRSVEQAEPDNTRKMIVVLPFENLGSKDENYFADGVTEEITSKLASIGNIGVISRSSAEKLANSNKSTKEIGKELGVNYILSGTIRWAKDKDKMSRVRITPQLTRVSDNTITWSDSYDKVLDDIFNVQNDIAQKVVDQLGGSLSTDRVNQKAPTDNIEAYDYYLRGLSYESRGSYLKSDFNSSIKLYQKAIELDPGFALAYSQLSRMQASNYWFYYDRSSENVQNAFKNAQKAFELDPDLAEGHLALGYFYYWCRLDYGKAIEEFTKARDTQPNNAEAAFGLAVVYRRMGQFEDCIKNMLKAVTLDPLSIEYVRNTGETYALLRDYGNSIKYYKKAIELSPDVSALRVIEAYYLLLWKDNTKAASQVLSEVNDYNYLDVAPNIPVLVDMMNRNYDKALRDLNASGREYETGQFNYTPRTQIAGLIYKYKNQPALSKSYFDSSRVQLEKLIKENPSDERFHSSLGITYAGMGLNDKAVYEGKKGIELLPLDKEAYRGYYRQWDLAKIYVLTGNYDQALKQLDFILSIPGSFSVNLLKLDPIYDPLRDLPGYKTIIQKYSEM